ncbi:hypothetical protein ACLOJK_006568, partial [Asimina triloba]
MATEPISRPIHRPPSSLFYNAGQPSTHQQRPRIGGPHGNNSSGKCKLAPHSRSSTSHDRSKRGQRADLAVQWSNSKQQPASAARASQTAFVQGRSSSDPTAIQLQATISVYV